MGTSASIAPLPIGVQAMPNNGGCAIVNNHTDYPRNYKTDEPLQKYRIKEDQKKIMNRKYLKEINHG